MDKNIDMSIKEIFYVLKMAFLAIRATDSIKTAHIIADIFHTVPSQLRNNQDADAVMEDIFEKAARYRCEETVSALFATAKKNLADNQSQEPVKKIVE